MFGNIQCEKNETIAHYPKISLDDTRERFHFFRLVALYVGNSHNYQSTFEGIDKVIM